MVLKQLLTGGVIGLVSCGIFAAPEWIYVDSSKGAAFYLDKNSISEPPKYSSQATHKAWVKMVVHKDLIQDGLAVGDYQMILNFAHCEDKTLGFKSITSYTKLKNGLWNNNSITIPSVEMNYVVPSSIGEGILNTICS